MEDACEIVAAWHEQQAEWWRAKQHPDCLDYLKETPPRPTTEGDTT